MVERLRQATLTDTHVTGISLTVRLFSQMRTGRQLCDGGYTERRAGRGAAAAGRWQTTTLRPAARRVGPLGGAVNQPASHQAALPARPRITLASTGKSKRKRNTRKFKKLTEPNINQR